MTKGSRFESVWDAIENTPQQTAAMRARSESMMALQAWVKLTGGTQAEAARRLGVMQPRMSDLMCGKIGLFGLESLLDMATTACPASCATALRRCTGGMPWASIISATHRTKSGPMPIKGVFLA